MCRSIKQLRRPAEPPTETEISAAALQYIRKVSGYRAPFARQPGRLRPGGGRGGPGHRAPAGRAIKSQTLPDSLLPEGQGRGGGENPAHPSLGLPAILKESIWPPRNCRRQNHRRLARHQRRGRAGQDRPPQGRMVCHSRPGRREKDGASGDRGHPVGARHGLVVAADGDRRLRAGPRPREPNQAASGFQMSASKTRGRASRRACTRPLPTPAAAPLAAQGRAGRPQFDAREAHSLHRRRRQSLSKQPSPPRARTRAR